MGLLGVGGFSKVELWQHTVTRSKELQGQWRPAASSGRSAQETGATYALKSIDKGTAGDFASSLAVAFVVLNARGVIMKYRMQEWRFQDLWFWLSFRSVLFILSGLPAQRRKRFSVRRRHITWARLRGFAASRLRLRR